MMWHQCGFPCVIFVLLFFLAPLSSSPRSLKTRPPFPTLLLFPFSLRPSHLLHTPSKSPFSNLQPTPTVPSLLISFNLCIISPSHWFLLCVWFSWIFFWDLLVSALHNFCYGYFTFWLNLVLCLKRNFSSMVEALKGKSHNRGKRVVTDLH